MKLMVATPGHAMPLPVAINASTTHVAAAAWLVILTMFPNGTPSRIASAQASVLSKRKLRAIDAIRIARPALLSG